MLTENAMITNKEDADIFLRQLLNIGETLYQSGGEIRRIEDTLHRLGRSYGALHVSVYAITSSIVVTAEFAGDYSVTQSRRITRRESTNFTKLERINQLCRDCTACPIPVKELQKQVLSILSEKANARLLFIGQIVAAGVFALFFGGSPWDMLAAAFGAALIGLLQKYVRPLCSGQLFFNLLTSFITGIVVSGLSLLIPVLHVNQILIGDIMVLIPGIAITNSIRYILSGDIISSLEKLLDSLLQAFGIAAGFMLALLCVPAPLRELPDYGAFQIPLQLVAGMIGTLGFSLLFSVRSKLLIIPTIGGALSWGAYLLFQYLGLGVFPSVLFAVILVGIYGAFFSRILKVPNTIFFIPACVPLIPGSNLYYAAFGVLKTDWTVFRSNLILLTLFAVGIAAGLAIVMEIDHIFHKLFGKA